MVVDEVLQVALRTVSVGRIVKVQDLRGLDLVTDPSQSRTANVDCSSPLLYAISVVLPLITNISLPWFHQHKL